MRPIESKERTSMRQLQNLPRHRRFHRNRPTCFAKIGAILVGRHRRCRRFNEVLQLPHVVFGRNATILRPLKDPLGMPTEDVLTLLESRILGLSVDHLTTAASDSTIRKSPDALLLRCSDAEVGQDRASGVD